MIEGKVQNERQAPFLTVNLGRRKYPVTLRMILGIFAVVGGIWAFLTSPLWVRPWARPSDIKMVMDSVGAARRAAVQADETIRKEHGETRDSLSSLARQQETTNYVLCVFLRRTDPSLLTPGCTQTIRREQTRQREEENGR